MAIASIAYTAAAGGLALALSTTWLALRNRTLFTKTRDLLAADLTAKDSMLRELDSATSAFDEAFLAVEGDVVRLVWGEDTLRHCGEALGLKDIEGAISPQVLQALGDTSPEAAESLKQLINEGTACRFEVFAETPPNKLSNATPGLTLIVEGRASGATAWLRLAIAGARASLASGPFAQMAERVPAPCWICARDGRIVWANAAWLKAAEATSLEEAVQKGLSFDRNADALVMEALEQHIRREKATSNICTAQVLLAVIASMYAVYHGPEGLTQIARNVHRRAAVLAAGLRKLGFAPGSEAFFDTLSVDAGAKRAEIVARAGSEKINLGVGEIALRIALDETTTPATVEAVWRAFGGTLAYAEIDAETREALPEDLKRTTAFLTHPVFHAHRSETEMLRYMRKLSDRDLALDRAMIPLGSCTMKLNATTEMMPLTWPEFATLHPFVPREQASGYHALFARLEKWLCDITGYDAISLQPNSGAQGEYAGLLAIRGYHAARGESHRKICLIPSSAHGTNPASAAMVGMDVVVVACEKNGDVDVNDLRAKAEKHSNDLAAVMITYPSTHGVFEEHIREICDVVHGHGGQVYLDGANLNAQVGLSRPGDYGADVSHLNLHKTFCIPHGGGGPGMGPIGVKAHLAPFLPGHPGTNAEAPVGPVSAAPFGSASILTISYIYILMMGGEGLKRATEIAILNANYIAARLDPHFPVLYKNAKGRVAHECIVDPRALKTTSGVTVDDIAKRLIDYGFHAPTMSFPVPGTLMIEPTESESRAELDRFCDAMIAIRKEIAEVEAGRFKIEASPLRHAPHTVHDIADDDWKRAYSRSEGCFPAGVSRTDKYWSPVGRVDNVYGDRNLVCSCPPVSDYAEAAE